MSEDIKNKKSSYKDFKKLDQAIKDMHIHGISNIELNDQSEINLTDFWDSESFDEEIEQILANFNEETMDLTKLQTQIILLIKRQLGNIKKKNQHLKQNLAIDEKVVAQNIAEISRYLIDHKIERVSKNELEPDAYQAAGMSAQSRQDLRKIIKNFTVYQVYKIMNPRRIAGETRRDNFIHNMLVGGMNRAKHYSGGTKQEIARYSPNFIKYLENKSKTFAKNKGMMI